MILLWAFSLSHILNCLLPSLYFLLTNVDQLTGAVHGEQDGVFFRPGFALSMLLICPLISFLLICLLTACDPLSLYCQQRSTVCFPETRKQQEIPYKIHKLTMVGTLMYNLQIKEGGRYKLAIMMVFF